MPNRIHTIRNLYNRTEETAEEPLSGADFLEEVGAQLSQFDKEDTHRAELQAHRQAYFPGRLYCGAVGLTSHSVSWESAFQLDRDQEEERAALVFPAIDDVPIETLLADIGEDATDKADEFRDRLRGLSKEDAEELAALDAKALTGPIVLDTCFPRRLTESEFDRMRALRHERDNTRETEEDIRAEVEETAREAHTENPEQFWPAMNGAWPLPSDGTEFDPEEAQRKLWELPVTLVRLDGGYVLALTGGGMDLSDALAEAYLLLGLFPPTELCSLPDHAGPPPTPRALAVIGGCLESLAIQAGWNRGKTERLLRLSKRTQENKEEVTA